MKTLLLLGFFGGAPIVAWLPAQLWTLCGDPWCLKIFPEWLDHALYSIAHCYLSDEITLAAEQMDFLEVWISSIIIIQLFTIIMYLTLRNKFREDEYDMTPSANAPPGTGITEQSLHHTERSC